MKISNVIQFLENQKREHGDLQVLLLGEKNQKSNLEMFVISVAEEAGGSKFVMICNREKAIELDRKQAEANEAAQANEAAAAVETEDDSKKD